MALCKSNSAPNVVGSSHFSFCPSNMTNQTLKHMLLKIFETGFMIRSATYNSHTSQTVVTSIYDPCQCDAPCSFTKHSIKYMFRFGPVPTIFHNVFMRSVYHCQTKRNGSQPDNYSNRLGKVKVYITVYITLLLACAVSPPFAKAEIIWHGNILQQRPLS